MRILVVDDEPLISKTVSIILRKHGFDVTTADCAEDALTSAVDQPPDLVLCDIDMPGRDGIALMEDLGRHLPLCPILVLTGYYNGLEKVTACAASLRQQVRILTKPCPPAILLQEADALLAAV
jgi:CheY-like chemotaxis protein